MIHCWANVVEGVLWIAIAGIILARTGRGTDRRRWRIATTAAIGFFWFGISDFIEVGTGAWYRPVWLLMMKAVCVAVLVHCYVRYVRLRSDKANTNSQ